MSTPLEYGNELLKSLEGFMIASGVSVPQLRWAQLGDVVMPCEGLVVSARAMDGMPTGTTTSRGTQGMTCDYIQVVTYLVVLARDCANVANDDGTNNHEALALVSQEADRDGTVLWDWATTMVEQFFTHSVAVAWSIEGGLGMTTLSMSVGVP